MASQATRLPVWSEFLAVAEQQGVKLRQARVTVTDPWGRSPPVRYFQGKDGLEVIAPPLSKYDPVQLTVLGNLCRLLEIDPTPLGYTLADLERAL